MFTRRKIKNKRSSTNLVSNQEPRTLSVPKGYRNPTGFDESRTSTDKDLERHTPGVQGTERRRPGNLSGGPDPVSGTLRWCPCTHISGRTTRTSEDYAGVASQVYEKNLTGRSDRGSSEENERGGSGVTQKDRLSKSTAYRFR